MVTGKFTKRTRDCCLATIDCLVQKSFEKRQHGSQSCDIYNFFRWNLSVVLKIFDNLRSVVISELIQLLLLYFVLRHFGNLKQLQRVNLVEKLIYDQLKIIAAFGFEQLIPHQMKNSQTYSEHNFGAFNHYLVPHFEQQIMSKAECKQTGKPSQCDRPYFELTFVKMVHQSRLDNAQQFPKHLLIHSSADGLLKIIGSQIISLQQLNKNPKCHFLLLQHLVNTTYNVCESL